MTRVRSSFIAFSAAWSLVSGLALADQPDAMLQEVQGTVLVNQGEAYTLGYSGLALQAHDRVLLLDCASAAVVHADGSITRLEGNSGFIVGQAKPYYASQGAQACAALAGATIAASAPTIGTQVLPILGSTLGMLAIVTVGLTDDDESKPPLSAP